MFVQCPGCRGCKRSQRVVNHLGIAPHLFPTKGTGRSAHAGREGSGYIALAGCHGVGCSIQPSPLFSGYFSDQDSSSFPTAEEHSPHHLARCVCAASLQHSQRSGSNRGLWQGMAPQWAGRELRPRAASRPLQNPLAASSLKIQIKETRRGCVLVKKPSWPV